MRQNRFVFSGLLVIVFICVPAGFAERGQILETFEFRAARFALHPFKSIIYATLPDLNSVAIIDTPTLTLIDTVYVGSTPNGMAVSPDGKKLFVANRGTSYMGVLDTETNLALPSILLPSLASDVEAGLDGRLYVTAIGSSYRIMQINGDSGEFVDDFSFGTSSAGGFLEISPDRTSLYMGNLGSSPSQLAEFNVEGDEASLVYVNPHGSLGSNGQDLGLNHNGDFISYPCGGGNGTGYTIFALSTANYAILGSFNTGAYPQEITFSPDDLQAYTVHTSGRIDRFSTTTFLALPYIATVGEATELMVDHTGRHLFAAFSNELRVYDTGESCTGFVDCLDGPEAPLNHRSCICFDITRDGDVDLRDAAFYQVMFFGGSE